MQTFLPYPDFAESARVLDNKRLGKQRVECVQILKAIQPGYVGGWRNHPAVRMWRGWEDSLKQYTILCIEEWVRRGFRNTIEVGRPGGKPDPTWLGREDFHASHRSNLLRKNAEWYGQWGWTEGPDLPYVWPV